ncbi:MAG TPA: hypothetical protein VGU20_31855 [Stellaceae bacterium]|nr:hypothetical protein [Stellaceae bacterium]
MNQPEVSLSAAPRKIAHRRCATVTASDDDGRWLVRDDARRRNVAFTTRRAAIRFAVFGTLRRPGGGAALMIPSGATKL